MNQDLRHRLLRSVGATSLGPLSTAVIQLISVPIFLNFWGPKLYGEWLVLSAVPTYLGLTDFGFGGAAATEMTMQVARGDTSTALEAFQSTWVLTTVVSVALGLCVGIAVWILPLRRWLNISLISNGQVNAILCVLCVFVLLDLQWTVITAGFRCDGNYALGALLGNIVRFATNAAATIVVLFHVSPLVVALTFLAGRLFGNQACRLVLRHKSPWLRYGSGHAHISVIRKLFGPAIAYMAFPLGNSLSLQGMTIVVAAVLGPIAVVTFSTIRTLTRFAYQMVDMIANSVWPELSAAFGSGDRLLAKRLHRCACQASLGLSLAAVLILMLFGNGIYSRWTHHKLVMDQYLFHLLLVEVLANSLWFTSSIVPVACNCHERVAAIFLSTTAISLPVAYFIMLQWGLLGAGISLLLVDLCMISYVFKRSLALLQDNLSEFTRALFRSPLRFGSPEIEE
jgi:O-antigen/teichoic acid export membrane protein